MARIVGVDLPREKRVEAGLQYIHGIGPSRAREVLGSAGIDPRHPRSRPERAGRRPSNQHHSRTLQGGRRFAPRSRRKREAAHGHQLLSRATAQTWIARARTTHANQRPDTERPPSRGRQEEIGRQHFLPHPGHSAVRTGMRRSYTWQLINAKARAENAAPF